MDCVATVGYQILELDGLAMGLLSYQIVFWSLCATMQREKNVHTPDLVSIKTNQNRKSSRFLGRAESRLTCPSQQ